jgi:hypothetical protein
MPCRSDAPSGDDATQPPRPGPLEWLFGFPRAVYDQGAHHGRDWHRNCASDDSSGKKHDHRSRWHRRCERHQQKGAESRPAGDAPLNWAAWVKAELERGEKVAKGMYNSWDKEYGRGDPVKNSDPARGAVAKFPAPVLAGQLWNPLEDVEHDLQSIFARLGKEMQDMEQMSNRYGPEFWEFYMLNPYSPLRLEHEAGFDSSWRTRFEDLIRAERQQELLSKEEAAVTQRQSAFDWFHGLQSRVEPANNTTPRWQENDEAEQKTELDAYNQVLPQARFDEFVARDAPQKRDEASEPNVKSVFRTVNSYTERDGSVTTKTVVRKTFADGKSEKTETVETSQPRRVEPPSPKRDAVNPTQNGEVPRRGWFWSS